MPRTYDTLQDVDISGLKFTSALPLGPDGVVHGKLSNGMT